MTKTQSLIKRFDKHAPYPIPCPRCGHGMVWKFTADPCWYCNAVPSDREEGSDER
jgi:hypothetical protein